MTDLVKRLTLSLAHTVLDAPRPLVDLELPADKLEAIRKEFSHIKLKAAAVLIGIVAPSAARDDSHIVLTRRSEALKNHPGQISFPGGRLEDGDSDLRVTALRESEEEIHLPQHLVDVVGYLPDYPTITGYRVTPVVGLVDAQARAIMRPDGIEATQLHHLPLSVALDKDAYEIKMMKRNQISVPVYHLQYADCDIWGATAGMLYQLARHFRQFERTN